MPSHEEFAAQIEQRQPVVTEALPEAGIDGLNRDWALLTEAARRDMLSDQAAREALMGFTDRPVDQNTAGEMVAALHDDARITRLAHRAGNRLLTFLQLPEVPESAIVPDIKNGRKLRTVDADVALYRRAGLDDARAQRHITQHAEDGHYTDGTTFAERQMVARKYAFARDVKLLALGAELVEHGPLELSADRDATLASGIHIQVSPDLDDGLATTLIDPTKWESRKQLKDRVYLIEVDGNTYLLKERKTARHTDTQKNGHRDGQTVAEEYRTGLYLHDHETKQEDRIQLSWEQPLGYVEYPDGFQFGVYAFEHEMRDYSPTDNLERTILENRPEFESEFAEIAGSAEAFREHPLVAERHVPKPRPWQKWRRQPEVPGLSFEEFAHMKARRMGDQAVQLYYDALLDAGYSNSDLSGWGFRLPTDGTVGLEIIGYDYEYYHPITQERVAELRRNHDEYVDSAPRSVLNEGMDDTVMEKSAYMALLDAEGRLPDSVKLMERK